MVNIISWNKSEMRQELVHWTLYGVVDGGQDIVTAFDQAWNYIVSDEDNRFSFELNKFDFYTEEFLLEVFQLAEEV